MSLKITALTLSMMFIINASATQNPSGSVSVIKVQKVVSPNSCTKEGERKCNSCFTGINSTPGGSHWVCLGGQWKPASPGPYNCDTSRLCQ